jgi:hypothetical protein
MVTECRNSIKKPSKISPIAETVLSERSFIAAKTAAQQSPLPVAVEIDIAPTVSRTKPRIGSANR